MSAGFTTTAKNYTPVRIAHTHEGHRFMTKSCQIWSGLLRNYHSL